MENRISDIIAQFPALNLEQVNKVGLMNRVDTKFYFSIHLLPKILESIKIDYSVLEINGSRMMPYESTYYDTKDFQMLRWHQNGKGNRYKIRERKYVLTEQTFFEVKFKSNKGKTIKSREEIVTDVFRKDDFISSQTPFDASQLMIVLRNKFQRIMLVNNKQKERVSIDINLGFSNGDYHYQYMDKLVVLEIKSDKALKQSSLKQVLKTHAVYANSFSKFVTGMHQFHKDLKYNRFKNRFRRLEKIINTKP